MNLRERFKNYKRIVVKVGTSSLTYDNGRLNLQMIDRLSLAMSDLRNQNKDVMLVSSGAIGVGSVRLDFSQRPEETRQKQAAAAVGQAMLIQIYQNLFNQYNQKVAQILLTKEDLKEGERKSNTINTLETLLEMGVIPIINANDTISTFEIEFSDNDSLSASVASLMDADLLIILTDIDVLYDNDPRDNKNAKRVSFVDHITDEIKEMAGNRGSTFSVGGMVTKITAAEICAEGNVDMVVAEGKDPFIIEKIINGEDIGTFFFRKK